MLFVEKLIENVQLQQGMFISFGFSNGLDLVKTIFKLFLEIQMKFQRNLLVSEKF